MYMPVAVPHQMEVATAQIRRSDQMPAIMVEMRAFLSPTIQTWVASHTKVGAKYINRNCIFSTRAPKCLQVRPWADSWKKAMAPNRNQNSTRSQPVFAVKL